MGESAAKRQPIDLDEFERRLRAPIAQRSADPEDPLAELARLVGGGPDPFAPIFAAGRADPRPVAAAKSPAREKADEWDRLAAATQSPAAFDQARDLRGTLGERSGYEPTSSRPAALEERRNDAGYAEPPLYAQENSDDWDPESGARRDWSQGKRSRKSIFLMTSALLLVLAGVGGTLALRGHGVRSGPPPTILAATSPVKVKPPHTPSSDPIERSSSFLNQPASASATVAPAHVVDSEEQPIDLSQAVPNSRTAPGADRTSADETFFPKPRRVKTVSVRPDGSIISDDDSATQASNAPPQSAAPAAPVASGPEPASDLAPGPTAQPEPVQTAPAALAPTRPQPEAKRQPEARREPPKPSPFKSVARIPTAPKTESAAVDSTASLDAASAEPAQRAETRAPDAASAASGGWAVQLAAPGSEQDARGVISRLSKKYAGELGAHKLGYHEAKAKGRTVWRVRVAGLAEPDAMALCNKIKSGGGACFVAKD